MYVCMYVGVCVSFQHILLYSLHLHLHSGSFKFEYGYDGCVNVHTLHAI